MPMLKKIDSKKPQLIVPKEALEFQPDAEELELTPLPPITRMTLHAIIALLVVRWCAIWH